MLEIAAKFIGPLAGAAGTLIAFYLWRRYRIAVRVFVWKRPFDLPQEMSAILGSVAVLSRMMRRGSEASRSAFEEELSQLLRRSEGLRNAGVITTGGSSIKGMLRVRIQNAGNEIVRDIEIKMAGCPIIHLLGEDGQPSTPVQSVHNLKELRSGRFVDLLAWSTSTPHDEQVEVSLVKEHVKYVYHSEVTSFQEILRSKWIDLIILGVLVFFLLRACSNRQSTDPEPASSPSTVLEEPQQTHPPQQTPPLETHD